MLETKGVSKYFGGLRALQNVNMIVEKGEIRGLIGPNGSGKTTLINVITGFYKPSEGRIVFDGTDISGNKPCDIAKCHLVRTFQNLNLFPDMTVLENVLAGRFFSMQSNIVHTILKSRRFNQEEKRNRDLSKDILELVGLSGKEEIKAQNLPYGQQRLLEIARALATKPKLLLLDEPVAGMNEKESNEVALLIEKLREKGITILVVEHHMRFVMNICDNLTVLNSGTVIAEGSPKDIQRNEEVIRVYLGRGSKTNVEY